MSKKVISIINDFLKDHKWCDFEIIKLMGDLKIGGKTGFNKFDIFIEFRNVFFVSCLYEWKTNTDIPSFLIPDIKETRELNLVYNIEQGHQLFKILAEDIKKPMYVSCKEITVGFPQTT